MNCVILQPSYIPWRGYFDLIKKADLFIFYDCVQYDKSGWRNRNRIKTPQESTWLTIPVFKKGVQQNKTPISQIKMKNELRWQKKHLQTLHQTYSQTPYFDQYWPLISSFFEKRYDYLANFTIDTTVALARALDIDDTQFMRSSKLDLGGRAKTDRLIEVLQQVGATHYISGPAAKDYIENDKFEAAGISLEYMNYDYPPYQQLYPPYDPYVSVVDLLFMTGPDAGSYIWD